MLNKTELGQALFNVREKYNNKTVDDLVTQFGSLSNARLQASIDEAEAIINHFKTKGVLIVPAAGLSAPNGPVTGSANTGRIE